MPAKPAPSVVLFLSSMRRLPICFKGRYGSMVSKVLSARAYLPTTYKAVMTPVDKLLD
jgi:hypothetical protein